VAHQEEDFLQAPTREGGETLVALDGGRLLGCVHYWDTRARPHIPAEDATFRWLAVDPAARGAGVGEALVLAAVERARAADPPRRRVIVHTVAPMRAASRLYERLGFIASPDEDLRDYEVYARCLTLTL
jgi:GNAT superfamily N-acetyltransferase